MNNQGLMSGGGTSITYPGTLLWTNSTVTNASGSLHAGKLSEGTIALDLSKYKIINIKTIHYAYSTGDNIYLDNFAIKNQKSGIACTYSNVPCMSRSAIFTDAGITFSKGYYTNSEINDTYCVPYQIYGIA